MNARTLLEIRIRQLLAQDTVDLAELRRTFSRVKITKFDRDWAEFQYRKLSRIRELHQCNCELFEDWLMTIKLFYLVSLIADLILVSVTCWDFSKDFSAILPPVRQVLFGILALLLIEVFQDKHERDRLRLNKKLQIYRAFISFKGKS